VVDIKPGPLPGVEAWNKKRLKRAMEEKKAEDGKTSPKRKQPEQGDEMSLNNAKRMKTECQKVHVMYRVWNTLVFLHLVSIVIVDCVESLLCTSFSA
jgi:hypothetical protein